MVNGAIVHRGVYSTDKSLSAYTIIGGLGIPKERFDEISRMAGHTDWDD